MRNRAMPVAAAREDSSLASPQADSGGSASSEYGVGAQKREYEQPEREQPRACVGASVIIVVMNFEEGIAEPTVRRIFFVFLKFCIPTQALHASSP